MNRVKRISLHAAKAVGAVRRYGILWTANCVLCKISLHALRLVFKFDRWHADSPYGCREYKKQTLLLASHLSPSVTVDIGCGLGEVLGRSKSKGRYGLDRELAVINAAKFLHGSTIVFDTATLFDPEKIGSIVRESEIDLLIMTGWLHGVPIEELLTGLRKLNSVIPVRTILIDGVHPSKMDDRGHYHSSDSMKCLGEVIRSVDAGDGARELHLVRLGISDG